MMNTNISLENLNQFEQGFDTNPTNALAMNAVVSNGINAVATNYQTERRVTHEFSLSLKQGKVTNQKKSGRCWMFAALNCLRFQVMHKLNLENFELSQSYTLFYDKLEKSNYFLESNLETLDEPSNGRLISIWFLLRSTTAVSGICCATLSTSTVWFQKLPCRRV